MSLRLTRESQMGARGPSCQEARCSVVCHHSLGRFSFPGLPGKQWFAVHLLLKSITKIKMTIMAGSEGQRCSKLLFMVKRRER